MTEPELAKLYARYGYTIFRRCLVYLGDTAQAQAIVQEVFFGTLKGPAAVRGDVDPRTWLCRIADALCVERLRCVRRSAALTDTEGPLMPLDMVEEVVAHDDPRSIVSVRRIVQGLDPKSVRFAVLYFFDELTQEELGQELNRNRRSIEKGVAQLLDRARMVLPPKSAL